MKRALFILICVASTCIALAETNRTSQFQVLVFSKTLLYRHASITNGIAAIKKMGNENRFSVFATEDAGSFTDSHLSKFNVVVFLSTSGDILNDGQQMVLRQFIERGGGFVGIHAAMFGDVATEGNWPWYGELFCTAFTNHSEIVEAAVVVEERKHPSTFHLPSRWTRVDEWYNFTKTPRDRVNVLLTLDESSYSGGTMGHDHPIAWWKRAGKGSIWYTALGHTEASYNEPFFLKHILGGIYFAAGIKP